MISELNAILAALEKTAWELRAISDEVVRLGGEARVWKTRGGRLSATELDADARGRRLPLVRDLLGVLDARQERDACSSASIAARRAASTAPASSSRARSSRSASCSRRGPICCRRRGSPELAPLQDAAPPVAFAEVRATLEAELGAPIAERFAALRRDAAGRGQHRAGPPRRHPRRAGGRAQGAAPGHRRARRARPGAARALLAGARGHRAADRLRHHRRRGAAGDRRASSTTPPRRAR